MHDPDPYKNSTTLAKLKKRREKKLSLKIAFLDIDSTIILPKIAELTDKVRKLLEKQGYVVAFVTSRTEEIIISEEQRLKSLQFNRPPPHLGTDLYDRKFYVDPKNTEPEGILDSDIVISSTGTKILFKQSSGGYIIDSSYTEDVPTNPQHWREEVLDLIAEINNHRPITQPHENEYIENYEIGISNVAPPDYRVELKFMNLKNKIQFVERFSSNAKKNDLQLQLTDDSNPTIEKYTLYITPKQTTKVHAVEHVVQRLCEAMSIPPEELELFIAGDSYPDLAMGLYGGRNSNATFLLVGGSRLADYILDKEVHYFADESLKEIKKNLVLLQSKSGGTYNFVLRGSGTRMVILGDEAFPNKLGPESILAYLNQSNI